MMSFGERVGVGRHGAWFGAWAPHCTVIPAPHHTAAYRTASYRTPITNTPSLPPTSPSLPLPLPPPLPPPAALKPRDYGDARVATRVDGAELLEAALAEGRTGSDGDEVDLGLDDSSSDDDDDGDGGSGGWEDVSEEEGDGGAKEGAGEGEGEEGGEDSDLESLSGEEEEGRECVFLGGEGREACGVLGYGLVFRAM